MHLTVRGVHYSPNLLPIGVVVAVLKIADYLSRKKMQRFFKLIQEVRNLNKEVADYNRYTYDSKTWDWEKGFPVLQPKKIDEDKDEF